MVPLELIYLFAGGALVAGLLLGVFIGLTLGGERGAAFTGTDAPPPPKTETGIALVRDSDGNWWIEVGKQRYRHLRDIHDHQAAMLVLEALQATRGMIEGSAPLPLSTLGSDSSVPTPAQQLDAILQDLLRNQSGLPYRAVHFETLSDGTLGIAIGGQHYSRPEEVPDPNLRALLEEAIRRWSGGKPIG